MGGYGLYYATVMQSVGLVALASWHSELPVDTVTSAGRAVAEAFRAVVADTEYYRSWIGRHDELVPREVVAEYGQRACFCRLREPGAVDRPLLVDAFLHLGNPEEADARRQTLRFMCELSAQSAAAPVDQSSFRRLIYFGSDHGDDDSDGPTFDPTESTLRAARRWRLYQAREYFNAAINEMWRRLVHWGLEREGDRFPVPIAEVFGSIEDIDFESFVSSIGVGLPDSGLSAGSPFSDMVEWVISVGSVSGELDDRWDLNADLTEDAIIEWLGYGRSSTAAGADHLAAALTLATLVAARLWNAELEFVEPADWFPVRAGGHERLGMQGFLTDLRALASDGATVRDVAEWLTRDYVISQHERVANAKLTTTGDTFRFRREAGRLRFFSKGAHVVMNDSRFNALATLLFELGWCGNIYERGHGLSAEGQKLRLEGDLTPTGAFQSSSSSDDA